jgi:hypothetical protein
VVTLGALLSDVVILVRKAARPIGLEEPAVAPRAEAEEKEDDGEPASEEDEVEEHDDVRLLVVRAEEPSGAWPQPRSSDARMLLMGPSSARHMERIMSRSSRGSIARGHSSTLQRLRL